MKYLTSYNQFEMKLLEDLQDILLPINDLDLWKAVVWENTPGDTRNWWVIIQTIDEDKEFELEGQTPSEVITQCVERAISFMTELGFKSVITFEEDETDQREVITTANFKDLDVWSNQFIRIEFSK
jgi:hypothetical protein